MVTNVLISGVEYRALNDYQIKQQAGAVGTLSITVGRVCPDGTVRPIPISQQSAIIKIDGAAVASGIIQKVTGGQYGTGYEPMLFNLDIQSFEAVLNRRLIKHNFYSTTTPTISDIVLWIYNNILAEEGFSLGKISATSEYIRSYKKNYEKVADVLDDLAGRIDGCSWYITPEKVFYFLIADDFPTVATPTHITDIGYSEASGDLRTVQTVVGASSRITGTEDNPELIASIAILSGTSGKIEVSESDSTIHNDNDALSSAQKKIEQYGERERTVTLTCNDLAASALYNTWTFEPDANNRLPAEIEGDFVITERTISVQGDRLDINVTLKNRNYFCRYGYTYKKFQRSGKDIGDAISDIYSDNKLTPVEKITTRQRWDQAVVEKSTLDEKANFYGVSAIDYDAAFQSVADYLNGGIKWVYGYPAWITDDALSETTDYDLQEYSSKWNDYEAGKSECLSLISNAQLAVLQNNLDAVRNGDLVDGAIDRAKLEAGFVEEHETLITDVDDIKVLNENIITDVETLQSISGTLASDIEIIKPLNEQLVQTIYPYGTQRQSLPELQGMEILEIEGIANALDHSIIDIDEFFVLTDNRFELLFKDVSDAKTLLTSLEIVPGQITAITEQLSDQEAALASLKILPGEIDAVSTQVTDHGQRIGSLEVGYDEINSILADLEVGGEIINLSLMLQNASRIEAIVADGGYIDENDVFHPTKAYTDVQQLANRFQIFVQGSGADAASISAWLATKSEISQFITDQEVNNLLQPVTSQLSTIDQTAEQISLQVSQLEGGLTWRDYATREAYLAALEALEAEITSGLIVAANRITLEVENRQNADTTLSGQITVQADRITAETIRASGEEVELAGLINVQDDRITAAVLDYQNADEELSAQIEIESGRITAEITRAIEAEGNLSSTLSSSIQMQADRITAEVTRATGQEATLLSQINVQADRITAAVADYQDADDELSAAIQIQSDRISSEVTRAQGQEATLQSNITQQADRITVVLADYKNADNSLAAAIQIQADRISSEITRATGQEATLSSSITQQANRITAAIADYQGADADLASSIAIEAGRITAEITRATQAENGISATMASAIQVQADRITAEVTRATISENNISTTLTSSIQAQADRITAEVSRATGQETTLLSQVNVQADRITAEITNRQNADSALDASILIQAGRISTEIADRQNAISALDSQLMQQANSIAARIQAKTYNPNTGAYETATEAFMALQVKLPETMSADRRAAIVALLTSQELEIFDMIYSAYQASYYSSGSPFSETHYRLNAEATQEDLDAMTNIFKAKGLLSSQFLVDADEILLNGTIRGEKLEMDSVSTNVFEAIQARIQDLTAKKLKVDTDEASQLDFEVQIDDGAGIQVKKNGLVIFSIDPITGNAYFIGNADIQNGIFRGSIESGPMILDKNPPTSGSFTISGSVVQFILNLVSATSLASGQYACSGTYGDSSLRTIKFTLSQPTIEYTFYAYEWDILQNAFMEFTWKRTLTRSEITISLYNQSGGQVCSYSDYYEPESWWVLYSKRQVTTRPSVYSPQSYVPAQGATVTFGSSGQLTLNPDAFTFKLLNLPLGYSDAYAAGTIYYDSNGFLKVKI